ncbi:MAG TPA: efflux RND transporter periplasmic adaptor subunit [Vicinamibacterales bacterium]|jgi:RND family efflux transporter MFP subunit|nr:efflux RND transporter periplasmic adaptor subunit [Vicinamibacterales bacterium]
MSRVPVATSVLLLSLAAGACTTASTASDHAQPAAAPVAVSAVAALEQPVSRFIRATGTLTAEDQAAVAAETAGRIVGTPVERGTPVADGAELVRISPTETEAQLTEAEANAAQIEARLGLTPSAEFDVDKVPEVQNAKASLALADSEFARIKSLLDQRVVSQSEYDQRKTQFEAARQQLEAARNTAAQQFQSLLAARARVTLARKAFADTSVRAPFAGIVAERTVSVGDYVTKGLKVVTVVRITPLRVRLTIPEQLVSAVGIGQPVAFTVDSYPGRQFQGTVKYVSPALEANQRALTVEASVPNPDGALKPGLFATALVEQQQKTPAVLVPAAAVQTSAGTSRVYVVSGDHVEERIVTVGPAADALVEVTNGLKAGEKVATKNVTTLADGTKVS